ncbi:GNAT family N-acetyltransferase [Plantactinospora sp. WMMC1484]|uniref:GNAT family N-acetyltransferase n=1 Tax=Plantactinospora sp. WMMC1484 TaxID=3404122 RepID=UPI003BF4C5EA
MCAAIYPEIDEAPEALWPHGHSASVLEERDWLALPRWPGDGAGYLATERALLPFRMVTQPYGWRNMNLVDVCAGVSLALQADPALVAAARQAAVPHLIVAAPGYHTVPIGERAPAALHQLVSELEREAARREAHLGFAHVPPDGDALLAVLRERGYRDGVSSANVRLSLPGVSFDDYLAGFGAQRRNWIKRERKRFAAAGGRLESLSGEEIAPALEGIASLEAELQSRHGFSADPAYFVAANTAYLQRFGDRMHVIQAYLGDEVVGSLTVYSGPSDLVIRTVGLRYRQDVQRSTAYFNLTYYATVELAYRLGLSRIVLGPATWEAKLRRGGRLVPLRAALPPGAPPALAELLRRTDAELSVAIAGVPQ